MLRSLLAHTPGIRRTNLSPRFILKCTAVASNTIHFTKFCRDISNHTLRITTDYPRGSFSPYQDLSTSSQYIPPQPYPDTQPALPQYAEPEVPQLPERPLPRYFSNHDPNAPSRAMLNAAILLYIATGIFIGHFLQKNVYDRYQFDIYTEDLWGKEWLREQFAEDGKFWFDAQIRDITYKSASKGLGNINLIIPEGLVADESAVDHNGTFKAANPGTPYEAPADGADPVQLMRSVWVNRAMPFFGHSDRPNAFTHVFWYAADGDYSQFGGVTPLVVTHSDGLTVMHRDIYPILGREDYALYAIGRSFANVELDHDGEQESTEYLGLFCFAVIGYITRRTTWSRVLARHMTIAAASLLAVNWNARRIELEADTFGMQLLSVNGFDPKVATKALQKLEEVQKRGPSLFSQIFSFLPEFMCTTNSMDTRIKVLEKNIAREIENRKMIKEATPSHDQVRNASQIPLKQDATTDPKTAPKAKKDDKESNSG